MRSGWLGIIFATGKSFAVFRSAHETVATATGLWMRQFFRTLQVLRKEKTSLKQQLQALAFQRAFWGIACLVLFPSPCNDSSLYLSFSKVCKATSVTHTKRIYRNLLRKETSFVCYASSVLIQIEYKKWIPGKKVFNLFQRVKYWHCSVLHGLDV